jgi:glycosyltransferase involved in cell wall biosynthesis
MEKNYVIIFTYYWPPASSGGVWRFFKTAKYLPEYNWTPIIVTVKNGAYTAIDDTLVKEVPENLTVHKTFCFDPYLLYNLLQGKKGKNLPEAMSGVIEGKLIFQKFSLFIRSNLFIPDPKIGWIRPSVRKGIKIIKTLPVKAMITTGPPNSTHLIGRQIKKKTDIPWIMDFRDPWSSNYLVKEFMKRGKLAHKIDQRLENSALRRADCVTGISPGLLEEFHDKAKRIETIYNGFDENDFERTDEIEQSRKNFILSYIGSLKPNQNILAIWEAIAELKTEIDDFKHHFILQFIGNLNPHIIKTIKKYGLSDFLRLSTFVPHDVAIRRMKESTVLLFIVPRAAYAKDITSGKIFEYMASKTPMLSVGPVDGSVTWILEKGKRDSIIDYDDKNKIKLFLKEKYNLWKKNNKFLPKHTTSDHLFFSRRKQAGQFARILNNISND